jgi:hypothetical protein
MVQTRILIYLGKMFRLAFCVYGAFCLAQEPCEYHLSPLDGMVLDQRNDSPLAIDGKKGTSIHVFDRITRGNVQAIFRHTYDPSHPEKLGAKAVALKTVLGQTMVWFFATGEGAVSNNVHHRDVLSFMSQHSTHQAQEWMNSVHETAIYFAERGWLDVPPPPFEVAVKIQDFMDQGFEQVSGASTAAKLRGNNALLRDDHTFRWLLSRAQGFQMTAEFRAGKLFITDFKIDSSITAFQKAYGLKLEDELQTSLLNATNSRIGKKLYLKREPVGDAKRRAKLR